VVPTEYNFRINDTRLYDRNIQAPPRKYNELNQVLGKPLMVPSQMYSWDVDSDKEFTPTQRLNQNSVYVGKVNGHQMATVDNTNARGDNDLRCTSNYFGYDATTSGFNTLGNGAKVGVKPISLNMVLHRGSENDQKAARELRIFTGVEKVFNIRNGEITISA